MPIKGTFTGAADVTVSAAVDVQVKTLEFQAEGACRLQQRPRRPSPSRPAPEPITQS